MMRKVRRPATLILAAVAAVGATVVTGVSAAAGTGPAGDARAPAASGGWGYAHVLPGMATLDKGKGAAIYSVSCGSPGNCSAGGDYGDSFQEHSRAFVVNETDGTWGKPVQVPGLGVLNTGGFAAVYSVSCASAGNCGAGGFYNLKPHTDDYQAFVVSEVDGTWQQAEEVPGTATLNQGNAQNAQITSVSCPSAGNCSAGGEYSSSQAFVVNEVHGVWQQAEEVPGTAALNKGDSAQVLSVSCASAGNCGAGGYYGNGNDYALQAFVASEVNGVWHRAEEVPSTPGLNQGGNAQVSSVSCASAGNCSAGGEYRKRFGNFEAFVVSEVNGVWGKAEEVPGTRALNTGGDAQVFSVSCGSAGNCSAGGNYESAANNEYQVFVVNETNGTWGKAEEVPGTATLNEGGYTQLSSMSCGSAGNCSAGGYYPTSTGFQAFVVSETNGTWGMAEEVPGTATLSQGSAGIGSVSCASAGHCSAGGSYSMTSGRQQPFVVSQP